MAARNDNARVGALRLYLQSIVTNIEVRQKLGLLPKELPKAEKRVIMIEGRFCEVRPDGKPIPIHPGKGHWEWREDADQQDDTPGLPSP